jgi:hypothetical protein
VSSVCDVIFEDDAIKSRSVPPLIEYNIARPKETARWPMYEAVSSTVRSVAQKGADEALDPKFAALFVRNVDKSFATKNAEVGDIGFITTPSLFRCHVLEGTSWRDVVQVGGVQ